ncbi:MAG: hydrolase Nlp/P60 [Paenibacillus sp.]|nr:hydrolase Nlp/P60 [Paenibacillus sp.]
MKKHAVTAFIVLILILTALPLQAWAAPSSLQVQQATVVASVNFRTGPSTSSARIRFLQPGENLEIISKVNSSWLQAKDKNGILGYVSSSAQYIKLVTTLVPPNGTIVSSVSFRTGPSTESSRIRYLKAGEAVWILEQINAYWYKVRDKNEVIGYISTSEKYIKTAFQPPASGVEPQLDPSSAALKVIEAGKKYLGTPYEFGSDRNNTLTFDCSDFVRQAFLDGVNLRLPADSRSQGNYVKDKNHATADWRQLKPGDLMFFMDSIGSKAADYANVNKATAAISHMGIYLGNGSVLHTYSISSGGVRIDSIFGTSWEYRFLFGGSSL